MSGDAMPMPFPHKMIGRVSELTPADLARLEVDALLLDIDGTVVPAKRYTLPDETAAWVKAMQAAGVKLFILSNNRRPERIEKIAGMLGLDWMAKAKKPGKDNFLRAAARMGASPARTAVVGDQIFTDMLGARRAGMKGILVESLDTHLWYFYPRRLGELIFRKEKP